MTDLPYSADRSLYGKLRRRLARVMSVRPAHLDLARPMVTFSFDDAPASAACAGARILDRHGARGTWFISAGLMGHSSHLGTYTRVDEVKALAAAGHEIGCHTFSHLDCGRASGRDIVKDLDRNQQAIRNMHLSPSTTFAYPYGDVSPQAKTVLDSRYLASRALHHGLVTTGTDLNQAPAVGIEGADGEAVAMHWLRKAAETPAWLVLYTHDVRDNPSAWGCTPEALERLAGAAVAMGFDLVTFEAGARRASHRIDAVPAQAA
jgi:peptidoglycan/xylan/chitin deacetylase (PgdA/CDA1 family)